MAGQWENIKILIDRWDDGTMGPSGRISRYHSLFLVLVGDVLMSSYTILGLSTRLSVVSNFWWRRSAEINGRDDS